MGTGGSVTEVSPLEVDLQALLSKHPMIGPKLLAGLYGIFKTVCSNGQMQNEEFQNFYLYLNQSQNNAAMAIFLGDLFVAFDDDQSGTMEFTEFINMLAVVIGGSQLDRLTAVFNICDLNKSGIIEKKQLLQKLKTVTMLSGETRENELISVTEQIFAASSDVKETDITRTVFLDCFMRHHQGKAFTDIIFAAIKSLLLTNIAN